jgi:hypothetical protein
VIKRSATPDMALFNRLPPHVRTHLNREHVLGWGRWQASRFELGYAVATSRALYLIKHADAEDPVDSATAAIGWDTFIRANWNEPMLDIVVQPASGAEPMSRSITLPEPGHVPEAVRDRVTTSIVASTHIPLVGDKGARFIARRVDSDSGLRWSVVFDAGLDSTDPKLRDLAVVELAALREQLGT